MRAALIIARKELAQRLRDGTFLIIGLAAPLVLAFIFNLVLGGVVGQGPDVDFEFGLVNQDPGPVGGGYESMLAAMADEGIVTLTRFEDEAAAQAAVDDGDVDAAFILPPDLSAATASGGASTIVVLGNVDSEIGTAVAIAIAESFVSEVRAASIAAQAAIALGVIGIDEIDAAAARAATAALPLAVETIEVRSRQVDSTTFFIAGLGVFFLFFIAGLSVTSMLDERSNGTLARLIAAPIRPASIIAGKAIVGIVLGVVAMFILAIASTLIMGADWGNPLAVAGIIVATVIAAAGLMTFVGGLARTSEQAGNLQSIVALTMAMLGGTFVPITTSEGILGTLRLLTPNAWYMRGLGDIAGGAYAEAWLAVGVLLLIGAVFGAIGLTLVRRMVRP